MTLTTFRRPRSAMATVDPIGRGTVLRIDTAASSETVKATGCTGVGPYTVTVRPVTWLDRTWWWLQRYPRRAKRAVREWWLSRCEQRSCWRREAIVDTDWAGWCAKHADGKEKRHDA